MKEENTELYLPCVLGTNQGILVNKWIISEPDIKDIYSSKQVHLVDSVDLIDVALERFTYIKNLELDKSLGICDDNGNFLNTYGLFDDSFVFMYNKRGNCIFIRESTKGYYYIDNQIYDRRIPRLDASSLFELYSIMSIDEADNNKLLMLANFFKSITS